MKNKLYSLFTNPIFLILLWLGTTLICCLMKYGKVPPAYNNFVIFSNSFFHALEQLPLYIEHPEQYDVFLYGIAFTPLIAVNELFTAVMQQQYNTGICGMIILSYIFIERKKEF